MSLAIVYTPSAKATFKAIYTLILNKFGKKAANKFLIKPEKIIFIIKDQPLMFKSSGIAENIRIGFITKQCAMFYRVEATEIQLLFFWDNRQEPML